MGIGAEVVNLVKNLAASAVNQAGRIFLNDGDEFDVAAQVLGEGFIELYLNRDPQGKLVVGDGLLCLERRRQAEQRHGVS